MSETGPLVPSLEKGSYATFRQSEVTYKQGQIGSKIIDYSTLQLPTNSCLHVCDNYLESPAKSIFPNLENPFIKNEQYHLFMDFVLTIPSKTDTLFPITDTFKYRPFTYNTEIRKFYTSHRNIKKFTSRKAVLSQTSALPIINYGVLSTSVFYGTFVYYRKFDLLLRTILSNVVSIEGKHQYLQMEISKTLYRKMQFQQTFDKISYQTVRIKNDPSFYLLIHLINFLSKTATTSLFSKLTQVQLDQFNIILTAGSKAIIYNLGDLKALLDARNDDAFYQLVIRHISALKMAGYADMDISELNDEQFDKLVEDVAPPETDHADEPETTSDTSQDATHIITSSNKDNSSKKTNIVGQTVKNSDLPVSIQKEEKHQTSSINTSAGANEKPVVPISIVKPEPQTNIEVPVKPYDPNKLTSVIDKASQNYILHNPNLTDEQKERVLKVSQIYKHLEVDGSAIEELLDQTKEPDITNGHLDFLHDKLDDKSMLKSTVIDLDRHYVQHMMAKDIASIAANMAQNGMFLVEVFQKDEITELDRIRHYKFNYEDINGRKHKVTFKLPIVTPDGTVMVNGIESRMIKQQVNLPICKIDTWRVSLSSNYNKGIVERITSKAHNFSSYITKYITSVYKAKVGLEVNYGTIGTEKRLPYDYTSIAARYGRLSFFNYRFIFDYDHRFNMFNDTPVSVEALLTETDVKEAAFHIFEKKYGVYCGNVSHKGVGVDNRLFFGYDNKIRTINTRVIPEQIVEINTFTNIFFNVFESEVPPPKQFSEWTEFKILDKNFPVVFILGFEFGLKRTLDHIKLDYKFYPTGEKFDRDFSTLVVPFADGNLVFDRYPIEKSFIVAGLLKFDTKPYQFASLDTQDGYYTLLQDSGISMNYLKGINDFFKFFIDPITRDVLQKMHEPTDPAGLLLRANQMLTTDDAIPSASMQNHRLRGYERFPAIVYNEMSRALATYNNQRGNRKIFSINPESVFLRIIQDQSLHIVDEINPVENIKDKHSITYTGTGGRTAQAFVIEDRQYPKDGVGIMSECTPDSGKVAINAYVTANPVIQNIRGMFDTDNIDQSKLEPSQILSATSLLMPCSTNDDRLN